MKNFHFILKAPALILPILLIFNLLLSYESLQAQQTGTNSLLVVIDGRVSSQAELAELPQERIERIDYLSGRDAQNIYGMPGASGALVVKIRKEKADPLVVKDGQIVSVDSLKELQFRKINVLSRRQAMNLYGPAGVNGALLVEEAEQEPEPKETNGCCATDCCTVKSVDHE